MAASDLFKTYMMKDNLFKEDYSEDELLFSELDVVREIERRSLLSKSKYSEEVNSKYWHAFSKAIDSCFNSQVVACKYFDSLSGRCCKLVSWSKAACCKGFRYFEYYTFSKEHCECCCSEFVSI